MRINLDLKNRPSPQSGVICKTLSKLGKGQLRKCFQAQGKQGGWRRHNPNKLCFNTFSARNTTPKLNPPHHKFKEIIKWRTKLKGPEKWQPSYHQGIRCHWKARLARPRNHPKIESGKLKINCLPHNKCNFKHTHTRCILKCQGP